MKVYNLACEQNHRFEGWFGSEEDFLSQSARQLIVCPICESSKVDKLPSAPHLNLSAARPTAGGRDTTGSHSPAVAQMKKQLMDMARHVMENTEDVGENFAEEARRIHYKEVPEHGIRGIASAEQRDELAEEGIEVFQLPLPATGKPTLQ
ncbi:hypothetical protein LT85_2352 [Collimonas arenae]|uniref:DUF1178 family protein n=1 Tax=Collimonas arenae TaxID=279058 RepID=A0A0A1FCK4_9BURK|nr:DUF1178 family protein [Collimonas arenae]AIY41510.1 hypothetical protein LT85_2352 [Collimonas arenae]